MRSRPPRAARRVPAPAPERAGAPLPAGRFWPAGGGGRGSGCHGHSNRPVRERGAALGTPAGSARRDRFGRSRRAQDQQNRIYPLGRQSGPLGERHPRPDGSNSRQSRTAASSGPSAGAAPCPSPGPEPAPPFACFAGAEASSAAHHGGGQLLEDVLHPLDQLGSVPQQPVTPCGERIQDRPRHREHLPPLIRAQTGGDERAAAFRGLHHQHPERESADDAVPPRKAPRAGRACRKEAPRPARPARRCDPRARDAPRDRRDRASCRAPRRSARSLQAPPRWASASIPCASPWSPRGRGSQARPRAGGRCGHRRGSRGGCRRSRSAARRGRWGPRTRTGPPGSREWPGATGASPGRRRR